nr:MAG TPA_asm: hypothetical protein [Caudoviricetes sp.]
MICTEMSLNSHYSLITLDRTAQLFVKHSR